MIDQLAREVIRERTSRPEMIANPRHPRTARVLRNLANKLDRRT